MRRIIWSGDALDDIDDMVDFVGRENPDAADLILDRIEDAVNLLADMPVGRQGRVKGTYEWYVKRSSYIIVYALTETSLHVVHIIHAARDWPEDSWPADDA